MASGAKVTDEVKDLIKEIKVTRNETEHMTRPRLAVFGFNNGNIDVEKIYRESDLVDVDVFERFKELLHPEKCRYILYDCQLETLESSPKKELVFVLWCPETGPIKEKMNYAASKDAIKKTMTGVKHNLQLNDLSDCSNRDSFASLLGKDLVKLEGVNVKV